MKTKKWDEDDVLQVGRLILLTGDVNTPVPEDDEFNRVMTFLGVDRVQLHARVNMIRSNHPDWQGGNPMNGGDNPINQRIIDQMVKMPA